MITDIEKFWFFIFIAVVILGLGTKVYLDKEKDSYHIDHKIGEMIRITTKDNLIIEGILKNVNYSNSSVNGGAIGTNGINIGGGNITNNQNGEITIYGHVVGQNIQNSTYIIQLNNFKLIEFLENEDGTIQKI